MNQPLHFPQFLDLINNLKTPTGNYGQMRSDMPQIGDVNDFSSWMSDQGVTTTDQETPVKAVKLGQNEISKDKIAAMVSSTDKTVLSAPVILSSDNYVLDGSHRFIAHYNLGYHDENYTMNAVVCDMPFSELLPLAQSYPGASFKNGQDQALER